MRSGGEGNFNGAPQTSGGTALSIHRSGGFEANIMGNYNALGWLFGTNDADWLESRNFGDETNDFLSIAHHEIGHALIFNEAHPGSRRRRRMGGVHERGGDGLLRRGGPVAIDGSDHLNGAIDPESGQALLGMNIMATFRVIAGR